MNRRSTITSALVGLLVLGLPAAAQAHALGLESDPNRPVAEYLWLGFLHMVTGWDHLLFIVGILLLAGGLRSAAKLISLFVLGHSLTLLVATIAGWKLDATFVDVVIALSVVFVGVMGLRGRPGDLRPFATAVFVFGLVHGLGLSTRLQALGLPDDGVVGRVVLFNVGVEIGQLVALGLFVVIGRLLAGAFARKPSSQRAAFGTLVAAGLIAAVVIAIPFGGSDSAPAEQEQIAAKETPATASGCTEAEVQAPQSFEGGHPTKAFFGPQEPAPEVDLAHVIGDGYVIVRYKPDLPEEQVSELQAWVQADRAGYTVAAPDAEQTEPLRAVTALKTATCGSFDLAGLGGFRDRWMEFVRTRTG